MALVLSEFEPFVCNKCHDILMMAYEFENIAILNVKVVDYRCILCNMTRSDATNSLNHYKLDDKDTLWTWILVQIKHLLKLKKEHLKELILHRIILVLMVNGTKSHGKNLMS